jgi:myo-inositol-1(or 4)-monophosphatase
MAVVPVVEGAGGRISGWRGEPLTTASNGRVVAAANETLWQEAVAELGRS